MLDDAVTMRDFRFLVPGVVEAEPFDVYLVSGTREIYVGEISYELEHGRGIELPNYPPMVVGASETVDDLLYVGVKAGASPTGPNRFLMESGFELYDINIWERPIRIAQLPTTYPVTGLAVDDQLVYLASGADGLMVVSTIDRSKPLVIDKFPVTGSFATDVALNGSRRVLAMGVGNDLGTGYIRFFDVDDPELDRPESYPTITLADDQLRGVPADVEWVGDELYVLLVRDGGSHLVIFSDPTNPNAGYEVHDLGHAHPFTAQWPSYSMAVEEGQLLVTTDAEYLVFARDEVGNWENTYWETIGSLPPVRGFSTSHELSRFGGAVFLSNSEGLNIAPSPRLAVSSISPGPAATLATGESVVVQLNKLFNTDPDKVAESIALVDLAGEPLAGDSYEIEAINTLAGGQITLTISEGAVAGLIRLQVADTLTALDGSRLRSPVERTFEVLPGTRPQVRAVARLSAEGEVAPYFHGTGDEVVVVRGSGFGDSASPLAIRVGRQLVGLDQVISVADDELTFTLPRIISERGASALTLGVSRDGRESALSGALVLQPKLKLQAIDPTTGPPEGGGFVNIYGVGLSPHVDVRFGQSPAGDLRLFSGGHLRVRAPSGSFGAVDVSISSRLFPDESSVLSDAYFYTNKATGSIGFAEESQVAAPVSAFAVGQQIVYAVTGGDHLVSDTAGLQRTSRDQRARLVLLDVSDPVRPVIIPRAAATGDLAHHASLTISPNGFTDVLLQGKDLFILGGNRLFHYDVTLPAVPEAISTVDLVGVTSARSLALQGQMLFVATDDGIRVFRVGDDRRLTAVTRISAESLGGAPHDLLAAGEDLWATLPEAKELVRVDLASGLYPVELRVSAKTTQGVSFAPGKMLLEKDILLVGGGMTGEVVAFLILEQSETKAVAELRLAQLVDGSLSIAGDLLRAGQTLYAAAGGGDVQIFDISSWLAGRFASPPVLENYFAVTGQVSSLGRERGAFFAGSNYVWSVDVAQENPIPAGRLEHYDAGEGPALSGELGVVISDEVAVLSQFPEPRAALPRGMPVRIQLNRIVDPQLQISSLLSVTLSGAPVPGTATGRTAKEGTELLFYPFEPLKSGLTYQVSVSDLTADIHGERLARDYEFRFVASGFDAPKIESTEPEFASWSGGEEITILGSGFDPDSTVWVGGQQVGVDDIVERTSSKMIIRAPALVAAPETNRVVGIGIKNGTLAHFVAGSLTYVTQPQIDAIGSWSGSGIREYDTSFGFNLAEFVGIRGRGFGPGTNVLVGGKLVEQVEFVDEETIVFPMPQQIIGNVQVSVQNGGGQPTLDDSLDVYLAYRTSVAVEGKQIGTGTARGGALLALLINRNNPNSPWRIGLYTTQDSAIPVALSTIDRKLIVHSLGLSAEVLVTVEGASNELNFFDISDPYAPEFLGMMVNPSKVEHRQLTVFENQFFSIGADGVHSGVAGASTWSTLPGTQDVLGLAVEGDALVLLRPNHVEVRDLRNPEVEAISIAHGVTAPQGMDVAPQRLAVFGESQVAVGVFGGRDPAPAPRFIGRFDSEWTLRGAAISGELLALATDESAQEIVLFDVDETEAGLALTRLARVDSGPARALNFNSDLLEWTSERFVSDAKYRNVTVPLQNIVGFAPVGRLASLSDAVSLVVAGDFSSWSRVSLEVEDDLGNLLPGQSTLRGDKITFEPAGDLFQQGGIAYSMRLFGTPQQPISGGTVEFDLPWIATSEPLFGLAPLRLRNVEPSHVVAGAVSSLRLSGVGFNAETAVWIDGEPQSSIEFVNNSLLVSYVGVGSGIRNVRVVNADGEEDQLPGSLYVSAPLTFAQIASSNPRGTNILTSDGGDILTVLGSGLDTGVAVHLVEAGVAAPSAVNRVEAIEYQAGGFTTVSPACVVGRSYSFALVKPVTDELITSEPFLCVDDIAPTVVTSVKPSPANLLKTVFSEPVTVSGYSVTVSYLDQSGRPETDVTSSFVLHVAGDTVTVVPAAGVPIGANRRYLTTLTGVADAAGNAFQGSTTKTYTSQDTLPPTALTITRLSDNQIATPAMLLTEDRTYQFLLSATDLFTEQDNLKYSFRASFDGGISYGLPLKIFENQVELKLGRADVGVGLKASVTDEAGNISVSEVVVGVRAPELLISDPFTSPMIPEEQSSTDVFFVLSGADADLATSAEILINSEQFLINELTPIEGGMVEARVAGYVTPRLVDLLEPEIHVAIRVAYGIGRFASAEGDIPIVADSTPPVVAIVAPVDGGLIPVNDETEFVIRAFDQFGIELLEAAVDGIWLQEPITPENPLRLTPTTTDPIVVAVRATDSSGLTSTDQVTVTPFERVGPPSSVEILSPSTGAEYRERQSVVVDLRLVSTQSANIFLEIGGDSAHPGNPEPVLVAGTGAEQEIVQQRLSMPTLVGDQIVVLRAVTEQGANDEIILRVANDDVVTESPVLKLIPGERALAGSEIWVQAERPELMEDFDLGSFVEIEDPTGSVIQSVPFGAALVRHALATSSDSALVRATLRDISGNEAVVERSIEKLPFLGASHGEVSVTGPGSELEHLVAVPGLGGASLDFAYVENLSDGGFRVHTGGEVIADVSEGRLLSLSFTGAALLGGIENEGEHHALFIPLEEGAFGEAVIDRTPGQVIGGTANVVFMRLGGMLNGYVQTGPRRIDLIGTNLTSRESLTDVVDGRIYEMSPDGVLSAYALAPEDLALERIFTTQLMVPDGEVVRKLAVSGTNVAFTTGTQVITAYLSPEELGEVELGAAYAIEGQVSDIQWSSDLLWTRAGGPFSENTWSAFDREGRVAVRSSGATSLVIVGDRLYEIVPVPGGVQRVAFAQLAVPGTSTPLALTTQELATELRVSESSAATSLEGSELSFHTSSGQLLQVDRVWSQDGALIEYRIPREAFAQGAVLARRRERSGDIVEQALNLTMTTAPTLANLAPSEAIALTRGATVPMRLGLEDGSSLDSALLQWVDQPLALLLTGNALLGSIDVGSASSNTTFSVSLNGNPITEQSITLVDNVSPSQARVTAPANQTEVAEGSMVRVSYSIATAVDLDFKYTQIELRDFNGVVRERVFASPMTGSLSLRAPPVQERQTYQIVVRGYFGDSFAFSDSQVTSIAVVPRLFLAEPKLQVQGLAMAGLSLTALIDGTADPGTFSETRATDGDGKLVASGGRSLSLVVPETPELTITAKTHDGLGNSSTSTRVIRVLPGMNLQEGESIPFTAAAATPSTVWFAIENRVLRLDRSGTTVIREFESAVSALTLSAEKLIVSVDGSGLLVLDALTGKTLASQARTQESGLLAVSNGDLLSLETQGAVAFHVNGNALEGAKVLSLVNPTRVLPSSDGFLVVDAQGLKHVSEQFNVKTLVPGNFADAVEYRGLTYLLGVDGQLQVMGPQGQLAQVSLGLKARQLVMSDSFLLGLSSELEVIDVRDPRDPVLLGRTKIQSPEAGVRAIAWAGKILFGGHSGTVLSLSRAPGDPRLSYETTTARGAVAGAAVVSGQFWAAAGEYGALSLTRQNGFWSESVYPSPYADATNGLFANAHSLFLVQPSRLRVFGGQLGSFKSVLNGVVVDAVAATERFIAAASGDKLYLVSTTNSALGGPVTVKAGDAIVGLAAAGDSVLVSTISREVLRVRPKTLPVTRPDDLEVSSLYTSSAGPIRKLVSDGHSLMMVEGSTLRRFDPSTLSEETFLADGSIGVLSRAAGQIWYSSDRDVHVLAAGDDWSSTPAVFSSSGTVSALRASGEQLLVGVGSSGLNLVDLPAGSISPLATLATPAAGSSVDPGGFLTFDLLDDDSVRRVRYQVNGRTVASRSEGTTTARVRIPGDLARGSSFEVRATVESLSGELVEGPIRRIVLRGTGIPENPDMVVGLAVSGAWLTQPAQLTAIVSGSRFPVNLVEFYQCEDSEGSACSLIGRSYGPTYDVSSGVPASGEHWFKAVGLDDYGNRVESTLVSLTRQVDSTPPQVDSLLLAGAVVAGQPIVGLPYDVVAQVSDVGSGVKSARLLRNGALIDARFDAGQLRVSQLGLLPGETVTYEVRVVDHAGLSLAEPFSVTFSPSDDSPPLIGSVVSASTIREQQEFSVTVPVSDDLSIERVEALWAGQLLTKTLSGTTGSTKFVIRDSRARISEPVNDSLTLRVYDSAGQVTTRSVDVSVIPDTAPRPTALRVIKPATGFFAGNLAIDVRDINLADDGGPTGLATQIVRVVGGAETVVASRAAGSRLQAVLQTPADDIDGLSYQFIVRLTDSLGQSADSDLFNIPLTQRPNAVAFSGPDPFNPGVVQVGASAALRVRAVDSAGRPVPNLVVKWSIDSKVLGTSSTSVAGEADFSLNTNLVAGIHHVGAQLVDFPYVTGSYPIEVVTGELDHLRMAYVPPLLASEAASLQFFAEDAAGNVVLGLTDSIFSVRIDDPDFFFEFADHVDPSPVIDANCDCAVGQRAQIRLVGGRATVEVQVNPVVGVYSAGVEPFVGELRVLRDHDGLVATPPIEGGEFQFDVRPASPARVALSVANRSNVEFGRPDVLEVGELATVRIDVVDAFGNRVDQIRNSQGAFVGSSFGATIEVSGEALVNSQEQATVLLGAGTATVVVRDDVAETVEVLSRDVTNVGTQFEHTARLELVFEKVLPAVASARFLLALNPDVEPLLELSFSEELVSSGSTPPWGVTLNGEVIAGLALVDGTRGTFQFQQPVGVAQCYTVSTSASSLVSLDDARPVLDRDIEVCSADVAPRGLEGGYLVGRRAVPVEMSLGTGVSLEALSNGFAHLEWGTESPVDLAWSFPERAVQSSDFEALGVVDGTDGVLTFTAQNGSSALSVANQLPVTLLTALGDWDVDGLDNATEFDLGLDPSKPDSDGDGTLDSEEDSDFDGLSNLREIELGTNLLEPDSDFDGLLDGEELDYSDPLDPDSDDDGLLDGREKLAGTNPNEPDTDFDGLDDIVELDSENSTDPSNPDSDSDGLSDGDEVLNHQTDPNNADHDGDGLNDGDEVNQYGTDPKNADHDGDGVPDGAEVATNNDPKDSTPPDVAAYVTAISVTPAALDLTHADIEPTRVQLRVNGTLTVGESSYTANVTRLTIGVNYTVADEAVIKHLGSGQLETVGRGNTNITVAVNGYSQVIYALVETCGNGSTDAGEGCDDGNRRDGDGCTAECVAELPRGPVATVVAGSDDSCALNQTGQVQCWGSTAALANVPANSLTDLSLSGKTGCAIDTDRFVHCWGQNSNSVVSNALVNVEARDVAVGDNFGCLVREDDARLQCWGTTNYSLQSAVPRGRFLMLEAGTRSVCGIQTETLAATAVESLTGNRLDTRGGYQGITFGEGPSPDMVAGSFEAQSRVEVEDEELRLALLQSNTIELWVKRENSSEGPLVTFGGSTAESSENNYFAHLVLNSSGRVGTTWEYGNGTNVSRISGTKQLPLGQWVHVAMRTSVVDTTQTVQVFVNGVLDSTNSGSPANGGQLGSFSLGSAQTGASVTRFAGSMSAVRVSSGLRTDSQILAAAQNPDQAVEVLPDTLRLFTFEEQKTFNMSDVESGVGLRAANESERPEIVEGPFPGVSSAHFSDGDRVVGGDPAMVGVLNSDFTVEMWLRPRALGIAERVALFSGGETDATSESNILLRLGLTAEGKVESLWEHDKGVDENWVTDEKLEAGRWSHLALVSKRVAGDRLEEIFLDGRSIGSAQLLGSTDGTIGEWTFGSSAEGSLPFTGDIADVRISSVARTLQELEASAARTIGHERDESTARLFQFGRSALNAGHLECWGSTSSGQTTPPGGLYISLKGSDETYCAQRVDGTVVCWGNNDGGQAVAPLETKVTGVAPAELHSCILDANGRADCWGNENRLWTQAPDGPSDVFTEIDGGFRHACARTTSGVVKCWGSNDSGQLSPPGICGDGVRALSEACDDGGTTSGDGCSADCLSTEFCGNGILDATRGEVCDDHQGRSGNYCSADCSSGSQCSGTVGECDDWNECTQDDCSGQLGCSHLPVTDGTSCESGAGSCRSGGCVVPELESGTNASCRLDSAGQLKCWGLASHADPAPGTYRDLEMAGSQACAIRTEDNTIHCWGSETDIDVPVDVRAWDMDVGTNVSYRFSCAVTYVDRGLRCWGSNSHGQLNYPSEDGVQWKSVTTATLSACALSLSGEATCWGYSAYQQLAAPPGSFKKLDAYGHGYCGLREDETVACWGENTGGRNNSPPGDDFIDVSMGDAHACALHENGVLECWGAGGYNDWPTSTHAGQSKVPQDPDSLYVAVTTSDRGTCALKKSGATECWGKDSYGELNPRALGICGDSTLDVAEACDDGNQLDGDGCSANCQSNEQPGNGIVDVVTGEICDDAGNEHGDWCSDDGRTSLACGAPGELQTYCDDGNECTTAGCDAQLGCEVLPVADGTSCEDGAGSCRSGGCVVPELESSNTASCRLDSAGQLKCWGLASHADPAPGTYRDLEMAGSQACAIRTEDNTIHCWGSETDIDVPVDVRAWDMDVGTNVSYRFSCAVTYVDRGLRCWGSNSHGQLNYPSEDGVQWKSVTTATLSACALSLSGEATCWGYSAYQQLAAPPGSFKKLDAYGHGYCGLREDETVACWGENTGGRNNSPPGDDFIDVSMGDAHACALHENGVLECWGAGGYNDWPTSTHAGQSKVPQDPDSLYVAVTTSDRGTCALKKSGATECWGKDSYGELNPRALGICGDSTLDVAEACDDGNQLDGDGCSANCQSNEQPGNGIVDVVTGEICDDAGNEHGDWCSDDGRTSLACGAPGELQTYCDDGNECTTAGCDAQLGCEVLPVADGTSCEGGAGSCRSGGCVVPELDSNNRAACLLDKDGQLQCWGSASYADPKPGVYRDLEMTALEACAIRTGDNSIHCWGSSSDTSVPPELEALDMAISDSYGCAVLAGSRNLRCWGSGSYGQVTPPDGVWKSVTTNRDSACALDLDDEATCWGRADYGMLEAPEGPFVKLDSSYLSHCGLRQDGTISCWGYNNHLQTEFPEGNDFVDVSMGYYHACALHENGRIECWTDSNYGPKSGEESSADEYSLLTTSDLRTCALRTHGGVKCWGSINYGAATPPINCGNGTLEPGEACDASVPGSPESCSADCLSTGECGNGIVDEGESCDDNEDFLSDSCISSCGLEWSSLQFEPTPQLLYDFDDSSQGGGYYLNLGEGSFVPGVVVGAGVMSLPSGVRAEAVSFPGDAEHYVSTGASADATESVTVSTWIHQNGPGSVEGSHLAFYREPEGGLLGWSLATNDDPEGWAGFSFGDQNALVSQVTSVDLTWNSWTNVTASYDAASDLAVLYINGLEVARTSGSGVSGIGYPAGSELRIGQGFEGEMDELAVWGSALNAAEVETLFMLGQNNRGIAQHVAQVQSKMPCARILADNPAAPDGLYQIPMDVGGADMPVYCDMFHGGWTLVYKKSHLVPNAAADLWENAPQNESDVTLLHPGISPADYSSHLINLDAHWSEARLSVVSFGAEQAYIQFNAPGANKTSWFSPANVAASSWTTLPKTPGWSGSSTGRYFDIRPSGFPDRQFYINSSGSTCTSMLGWLVVTQPGDGCTWSQGSNAHRILYSSITSPLYTTGFAVADALMIYVR